MLRAADDDVALRAELKDVIRARSFSEGATRTLVSGRTSNFYFDMKRTLADPRGAELVGRLVYGIARRQKPKIAFIGGMAMGAVPIVDYVALISQLAGDPIPNFWVRQKAKEHGTQATVEGQDPAALAGQPVLVADDVTTSGGSVLKAVEAAEACGAQIVAVVTIVDRLEGAAENLAREGHSLIALFTADDFRDAQAIRAESL